MTRFDRWSRDGMPDPERNAQIQRGIDATMRDAIADSRRGISPSASMIPERQRAAEQERPVNGGGFVEVKPPPGVDLIDRMVATQDRQDHLVRVRQAAELAEIERRIARTSGDE